MIESEQIKQKTAVLMYSAAVFYCRELQDRRGREPGITSCNQLIQPGSQMAISGKASTSARASTCNSTNGMMPR